MADDGARRPALGGWKYWLLAGGWSALADRRRRDAAPPAAIRPLLSARPSRDPARGDGAAARSASRRRRSTSTAPRSRRPFHSAWAGAADGDVVLVEFFDYACGYCRASNPDVERLLREDPRLKVVWRECPVLGPDSERRRSPASPRRGRAASGRSTTACSRSAGRPRPRSPGGAGRRGVAARPTLTDEVRAELAAQFRARPRDRRDRHARPSSSATGCSRARSATRR